MRWIDKLERRFGRFAVNNVMLYLIIFYVVGFLIYVTNFSFYTQWLCMDVSMILRGQVWRLVTFLLCPPSTNVIWLVLLSFIYYSLGRGLENMWGTFRFNLYILIGILSYILAAFFIYFVWGVSYPVTTSNLYLTMLLAIAMTAPETQFYLYFVIPIKAKWLGIFYAVLLVLEFISSGWMYRVILVFSLLNVLIFFIDTRRPVSAARQRVRRAEYTKKMRAGQPGPGGTMHRCAVCGRTELDDPNLEFRFCSKCAGSYEYCQDHLYTHVHVTAENQKPNRRN